MCSAEPVPSATSTAARAASSTPSELSVARSTFVPNSSLTNITSQSRSRAANAAPLAVPPARPEANHADRYRGSDLAHHVAHGVPSTHAQQPGNLLLPEARRCTGSVLLSSDYLLARRTEVFDHPHVERL